jgi:DNA-binding beta-propeller fold protein YncE
VVHTFYNTINMIRTIEDYLGMNYLGMNDANAVPRSDVFNTGADLTPYTLVVAGSLCQPAVDPNLIPECQDPTTAKTPALPSLHEGTWWVKATKRFTSAGRTR